MTTEMQDSTAYLLPLTPAADHGRANQAADGARLAELQGNVNFVKYRMLDRYSAFMVTGDISTGTPFGGATFETLQLPASPPPDASGERPVRTVSLTDFRPEKWKSFRVYNRGACSSMEDYPAVAQSFGDAVVDQLKQDSRVTNPTVTDGLMSVMLRSEFHDAIGAPDDRDRLGVRTSVHIDRLQGALGTDCRDLTMDIHFTVQLEHTDRMQLPIASGTMALGCRLSTRLDELADLARRSPLCDVADSSDPRWLISDDALPMLAAIRDCSTLDASGFGAQEREMVGAAQALWDDLHTEAAAIQADVDAGRSPVCAPDAQLFVRLADSDWTLLAHGDYSGRDAFHDPWLLLGLGRMNGNDLGAHDSLARVLSVSIDRFHDGAGGNCRRIRERNIKGSIEGTLRDSLPLVLNAAFMAGAVQDPGVAEADAQSWRLCTTDADCDFRAADGPAFQTADGQWRGARHVCRPSPDADACAAHGANSNCNFCAAQIEIDRINLRPDALEAVIEDDIDLDVNPQDPQASFELFASPLARPQVCDVARVDPDTGTWQFFPRPGGGYMAHGAVLQPQSHGTFSFPILPSSGGVGGATVPITTDGP